MTYKEALLVFLEEFGIDLKRVDPDKASKFNKKRDGYTGIFLEQFFRESCQENNFPLSRWYITYKISDLYEKYPNDDPVAEEVTNFGLYTGKVSFKDAVEEYEELLRLSPTLDKIELDKIDKYKKA